MYSLAIYHPKKPWNKNKLVGQKLPLKLQQILAIRIKLDLYKKDNELSAVVWVRGVRRKYCFNNMYSAI